VNGTPLAWKKDAMAAIREGQAVVQKAPTVRAPLTLGFTDCFALLLSFVLLLISAMRPSGAATVAARGETRAD
jgi:hypothetical protein